MIGSRPSFPGRYTLPSEPRGPAPGIRWNVVRRWVVAACSVVVAASLLSTLLRGCPEREDQPEPRPPGPAVTAAPPRFVEFGFPTAQTNLVATNAPGIFMPTASGRPESGLYGSVRTAAYGKSVLPSFHEGIDIVPLQRDRKRNALDDVLAAADGTVAHVNRIAGNSDYGLYVAMVHDDPAGPLYTLYAHLDEITRDLRAGQRIARGARLGRLGRTPVSVIPVERSHLHFEVGVLLNPEFRRWFQSKKLKPDHGNYSGLNLFGINPVAPYLAMAEGRPFSLEAHLDAHPAGFELAFAAKRRPNYFTLYPSLWRGEPYAGGAIVVAATDGGVPLRGRNATAEETEKLGRRATLVLQADPAVLGRNGRRLVVPDRGAWALGRNGESWLDILTSP